MALYGNNKDGEFEGLSKGICLWQVMVRSIPAFLKKSSLRASNCQLSISGSASGSSMARVLSTSIEISETHCRIQLQKTKDAASCHHATKQFIELVLLVVTSKPWLIGLESELAPPTAMSRVQSPRPSCSPSSTLPRRAVGASACTSTGLLSIFRTRSEACSIRSWSDKARGK